MTEYIERDAAINAVFEAFADGRSAYIALEAIPAADVRPAVRGKWKQGVCQTCFFDWPVVAPFASVPNFCPNCGAEMREES